MRDDQLYDPSKHYDGSHDLPHSRGEQPYLAWEDRPTSVNDDGSMGTGHAPWGGWPSDGTSTARRVFDVVAQNLLGVFIAACFGLVIIAIAKLIG